MHTQVGTALDNAQNPVVSQPIALHDAHDVRPTVFIIDGDTSIRESIELLSRATGWEPESFSSAEEFLAQPRSSVPCCVVVDLTLPGLSGLELQKRLSGVLEMPLIFVSGHTDIARTVQAMKAGAVEFLTKPLREDLLVKAIHDAIGCSRTAVRLHSEMRTLTNCYESLTPREREVMTLVVSGLLNKQVGFELGISECTVKAHRGQVMRKMQAESLPDLVMMAARLGVRPAAKH